MRSVAESDKGHLTMFMGLFPVALAETVREYLGFAPNWLSAATLAPLKWKGKGDKGAMAKGNG